MSTKRQEGATSSSQTNTPGISGHGELFDPSVRTNMPGPTKTSKRVRFDVQSGRERTLSERYLIYPLYGQYSISSVDKPDSTYIEYFIR
jgi:hypothetical protein